MSLIRIVKSRFLFGFLWGIIVSFVFFWTYLRYTHQFYLLAPLPYTGCNRYDVKHQLYELSKLYSNASEGSNHHHLVNSSLSRVTGLLVQPSYNHQADDYTVADKLYKTVKVLCWIMTSPGNIKTRALHVYKTWAHRCNKVLFFSTQLHPDFPVPVIKLDVEEGRQHLTAKTMHAFKYIYDNHINDAHWFMKADDDTFAIIENLRYFLSDKDPFFPVYYGHHFKTKVKPQGYYSGGGGYIVSREGLKRFAISGYHQPLTCKEDGGAEDVAFGQCMQNIGVYTADSYDESGASRFHALSPSRFINGGFPSWYELYNSHGASYGVDTISDYAITFHYIKPKDMYVMEFFTYHLKLYGVSSNHSLKIHSNYIEPLL